jgi:hypothetical protein
MVARREDRREVRRPVRHGLSHASLLRDVSTASVPLTGRRLDAIVVPAARPSLQRVISLSAATGVRLVVLCSHQAQVPRVVDRVNDTFGARALVVEVPDKYRIPQAPERTSAQKFRDANDNRSSDLSVKRNLGLLLARMCGWRKILFVDDDISQLRATDIARLTGYLDRYPVAGMSSRDYPDNSVVCHAQRLAGLGQDVFVSGAVLGVNTQHDGLSFFPDIYNEDWFFFARYAAGRTLPNVGEARQDEYNPFAKPERASREEFGDVLAEGLYALFEETPGWDFEDQLSAGSRSNYWELFMEARESTISTTKDRLNSHEPSAEFNADPRVVQALESLRHAEKQLSAVTPDLCVEFIDAWQRDDQHWRRVMRHTATDLKERDALNELGLATAISCGFGTESARRHAETQAQAQST